MKLWEMKETEENHKAISFGKYQVIKEKFFYRFFVFCRYWFVKKNEEIKSWKELLVYLLNWINNGFMVS